MSFDYEILSQNDLLELFPFGRSKLNALLRAGVLPVTKVGRDYITTRAELDRWFAANRGRCEPCRVWRIITMLAVVAAAPGQERK